MYISSFQILNYKSFLSSEILDFTSGFNIIVGQNNSGKTALLESLSLQFTDHPHRSLKTLPRAGSSINTLSECHISFYLDSNETSVFLEGVNDFFVPTQADDLCASAFQRFTNVVSNGGNLKCIFRQNKFVSAYFENYGEGILKHSMHLISDQRTGKVVPENDTNSYSPRFSKTYGAYLADILRSRLYIFKAERLNVGRCQIGNNQVLDSNAANLAEVLSLLQNKNPKRFERFNHFVSQVFPHIKQITAPSIGGNQVQIFIWSHDPSTERDDLAVPLSESGTGIGQVLAILYVVLTSDESRTIIIDEPQSFLHPGAIRKLFEILKLHSQHQFIITTHSPIAITDTAPKTIFLIQRQEFESVVEQISVSETRDLQRFLAEIGARLSDVFGADNILWVEGRTEELCFPALIERLLGQYMLGTKIVGVQHTGDFDGKFSKTVFEIYERLTGGHGLLPPAIGFIFDQEGRTKKEQEDLKRQSKEKVFFLNRRMYENYLLNLDAITKVISQSDSSGKTLISSEDVKQWLQNYGGDKKYLPATGKSDLLSSEWVEKVHASKLLQGLFSTLSANRINFDKVTHSVALTDWIINNSPSDFDELINLIKSALKFKN